MMDIGINVFKARRVDQGRYYDRPGCGWGSSKIDFELIECDPCFLGPESSS